MQLPELPKKYKRTESKIDGRVAEWFLNNYPNPVLLEVKIKGGAIKEHQQKLLDKISHERKFKYKFPDGRVRTPLDYIVVPSNLDAVLAICDADRCECLINNDKKLSIIL